MPATGDRADRADNTPEVHAYDDEYTIVLGDWYRAWCAADRAESADDEHAVLMRHFLSIANPGGAEPVPSALTSAHCLLTRKTRA